MPVVGMGGYFFRAKDPEALKAWYREHLGVGGGCGTDAAGAASEWVWFQQAGPTVFEPFKESSDYFPAGKQAMVNFRVTGLDALLADLRAAGIAVTREESMDGIGRFARIHDPEDNPIELWEPAAPPAGSEAPSARMARRRRPAMRRVERLPYSTASAALIILSLALPVGVAQLRGPEWLGAVLGLAVYLFLVWLTWRRLEHAGRPAAWTVLMLVVVNVGPSWQGPEPLVFHLSHLLHLVPVALGWLPPHPGRRRAPA